MMATRARRVTSALIAALALLVAGAHGATATADGPIDRNPGESVYGTQTRPLVEDGSPLVYGPDQSILSHTSPGASASWHLIDHLGSLRFDANPGTVKPTNTGRLATGPARVMPGIPAMFIKLCT